MSQTLNEFIASIPLDADWLRAVDAIGRCPHCASALAVGACQTLVSSVWCNTIDRHITRPGKYDTEGAPHVR